MTANMCISVVWVEKKKKKKKKNPDLPTQFFFQTSYSKHTYFLFGLS